MNNTGTSRWILPLCFSIFLWGQAFAQSTSGNNETPGVEQSQVQGNAAESEIPTDETSIAHGRDLFGQHCTACHQIEQQVIGPALASVHQRRPLPWLLRFIKNSQTVILEEKDEYAVQLYKQYNQVVMPPFEFLSNDDIVDIMAYIKAESVASTSSGGVNGTSNSMSPNESSEVGEDDAYSQKNDDERGEGDVASGVSGGLALAVIVGMLVLIGIIFVVARKSGTSARKVK